MKMDFLCADIAASPDDDTMIQKMKTLHYRNKDWQHPSKSVGPRGDPIPEERLKKEYLGIKLIYNDKLFWIHSVDFCKKERNDTYYITLNQYYK